MGELAETYQHVRKISDTIHDHLIGWARHILQEAGLDTIDVRSHFPTEGTTASSLVLLPYRLGPDPKVRETSSGISLYPAALTGRPTSERIPSLWRVVGEQIASAIDALMSPCVGPQGLPVLAALPEPLRQWYEQEKSADPWVVEIDGQELARPPALCWKPAFTMTVHYVAVATDPARGTTLRGEGAAPLAMSVLSVLAAGIHLEQTMSVRVEPMPVPGVLSRFVEALLACMTSDAGRILKCAMSDLHNHERISIAIIPAHDLSNQEFALTMQALQQRLQAALNLLIRLRLGARPELSPGSAAHLNPMRVLDRAGGR